MTVSFDARRPANLAANRNHPGSPDSVSMAAAELTRRGGCAIKAMDSRKT